MSAVKRGQQIHRPEQFLAAKSLVDRDGYSIRKAAYETEIPYQTLRDHLNGRYANKVTTFGPRRLLTAEHESSLSNYCKYMSSRGVPLSRLVVKHLARDIIHQQGGGDVVPSDKWLRCYLKRHPELSLRTAHPLQQDRVAVTQDTVDHYFDLLEETLTKLNIIHEPARIFNCDESGFSGRLNPSKKVIVSKGTRCAYQSVVNMSGHITILNAISAIGQTLPPMLIYSQCLPRSYTDGVPDSWVFKSTEKGYITTELFVEWFTKCFIPYVGEKRPVLLILDNHITHLSKSFLDAAKKHKIELLYLPAHSSHILQPQDVGYFHVLKQKVAELAIQVGYLGMKTLPRSLFPKLLVQALNQITGATVATAFKCSGIYPLNKNSVSALLPSSTECDAKKHGSASENHEVDLCDHCGSSKENPLVKMGLVAPELANILLKPPSTVPVKKSKGKRSFTHARSVLSEPEKKTTKHAPVVQKVTVQSTSANDADDTALCIVCMIGSREGYYWIGCDTCDKWYHYECLPNYVQVDVDLSLVTGGVWCCRYCQEE
ncbi:uncharacterized protein LOC123544542 [Mercenaria mercenaria]|uniref:uncharacterized protein LOC123544542 n=1 Tax=Mercenaria mercenaria TaxID=6596 RepID=UPI00234E4DA5|nr:uncharacterized protein LOC123544542 [Mercenaria mercenaria]